VRFRIGHHSSSLLRSRALLAVLVAVVVAAVGGTTGVRALGRPPGGQAPELGTEDEAGVSSFFPGVARVTILGPSCFSVLRPVSPPL